MLFAPDAKKEGQGVQCKWKDSEKCQNAGVGGLKYPRWAALTYLVLPAAKLQGWGRAYQWKGAKNAAKKTKGSGGRLKWPSSVTYLVPPTLVQSQRWNT